MNKETKPGKDLKAAAGLVASAAAVTVAAMAYKVNEEKVNASVDKAADKTKAFCEKASKKMRAMADDLMAKVDGVKETEPEEVVDVEVIEETVKEEINEA